MKNKARLTLLLLILFVSCGLTLLQQGQISPRFEMPRESVNAAPPEWTYPKAFDLKQLDAGLSKDFGLQEIGYLPDLHGSLAFAGARKGSTQAGSKISVFQKLIFDAGKLARVQNWELPGYQAKTPGVVGIVREPLFRNQNRCFVHVTEPQTDVGQSQLYELDLETGKGKQAQSRVYAFDRLLVSPDGKSYAYETAEPYNNAWYQLRVVNTAGEMNHSESPTTNVFSWTPRNTLVYPDYPEYVNPSTGYTGTHGYPESKSKSRDYTKNHGYPNIYENDLKGKAKLLKAGGYRPLMSPNEKFLANFVAFVEPNNKTVDPDTVRFDPYRVGRVALAVYDIDAKRDHSVTRIYEQYPDLFWSKDGTKLYVVEKFYTFSKKQSFCRISQYDTKTRQYKLICRLEQKGAATSYDDGKLMPEFLPIKLANNKYLLLTVQVQSGTESNFHVLAVDLTTGVRNDIFAFSSPSNYYKVPEIDWIDATPDKTG